jgi:hypothetical protein
MKVPNIRLEDFKEDEPLRLEIAAACAFPDGSIKASGLRREVARGRLVIERIAGKDYTTLRAIKVMREKCRSEVRVPACGSSQHTVANLQSGSFVMASSSDALDSARNKLKKLNEL